MLSSRLHSIVFALQYKHYVNICCEFMPNNREFGFNSLSFCFSSIQIFRGRMDTCSDSSGRSTQPAVLVFFGTWRRIQTISFRSSLLASMARVKPARRSIFIPWRSQTASLPTAPTKVRYSETLSKIPLKKGGKSLTTCYEYWMWICHWSCRQTWSRLLLRLQIIKTCMPSTCCGKKKKCGKSRILASSAKRTKWFSKWDKYVDCYCVSNWISSSFSVRGAFNLIISH